VSINRFYWSGFSQLSKALTYLKHLFILIPQKQEILLSSSGSFMSDSSLTHKQITSMLRAWGAGDSSVSEELIRAVYKELRWRARHQLQRERANHTLQTTALINEAYLKLVEQRSINWQNRSQFFGLAAEIMRRILVDHAKTRHRQKRGGGVDHLPLEAGLTIAVSNKNQVDVIALDEALKRLAKIDHQQVRIVELRYFSGLSVEDTADVLGISPATVKRDWAVAKAWLRHELTRKAE
jgi:RNA polymerase sigma factor (TIGR02999 family)